MTLPSPALAKLLSQVLASEAPILDLINAIQAIQTDSQPSSICTSTPEKDLVDPLDAEVAEMTEAERSVFSTPGANVDLGRKYRCGFGEVIYGEGKEPDLIARIIQSQLDAGQNALVTRIDHSAAETLLGAFTAGYYNSFARTLRVEQHSAERVRYLSSEEAEKQIHAAVVTAGSTDRCVAEEVSETLCWMGIPQRRFEDIGVAGPQRLIGALPELRQASVVVVAAGMEGALPAVMGGYLSVPIFAVPTSVGYGANFGGVSALLSMLNTCASNVSVVNIDSGFKGGYLAGLVANQLIQLKHTMLA